MSKYVLEITRNQRAERPSEAIIASDTEFVRTGNVGQINQSQNQDNYYLVDTEGTDLTMEMIRVLSTLEFNSRKMTAGDGWRIVEYPHSHKWTNAVVIRNEDTVDENGDPITIYGEAHVQWTKESTAGTEVFTGATAYADAQAYIGTLAASDGYVLLDEFKGNTQVLISRPSLWKDSDPIIPNKKPKGGSKNNRGRNDTDRY